MNYLKVSTAATIKAGPFLDEDDGKTIEGALTIAQADVRLSKNGGNYAQKGDATAGAHDEGGDYDIVLNTTDTGALGRLKLRIHVAGALPVWVEYMVLPAKVYDSLVLGTDNLEVDAIEVSGAAPETAAIMADAVWDEARAGHIAVGSMGESFHFLVDDMTVNNAGTQRYTAAALALAPSGTADWSATELNQIRHRLGIDGTTGAPSVNSPNLGTVASNLIEVLGSGVGSINDFKADVSALSTAAALAVVDATCDAILAAQGTGVSLTAGDITAITADVWGKTLTELSSGAPPATPDAENALMILYMALRNKITSDGSSIKYHDDAGSVITKKLTSDVGGVYTETEMSAP